MSPAALSADGADDNCSKEHERWLYKYFQSLESADDALLAEAKPYAAEGASARLCAASHGLLVRSAAALAAIQSTKLIQSDTLLGLRGDTALVAGRLFTMTHWAHV